MLLEIEMRQAARVVTGCPQSTPGHVLEAERRTAPAARLLAKARTFPAGDRLRNMAESQAPARLSTVTE